MKKYDVIIIGGGPAGMSAGIYSIRYGLSTLIVEKYIIGGLMNSTTEIKNYPGFMEIKGVDLSEKMKQHYLSYNGDILQGEVEKVDFDGKSITVNGENFEYKSLILAMGSTARKLELENEKKLTGHGISYCAICDGFFFKGKNVAVIGSGNSALEDSIYLSDLCKSVTVVSKYDNFQGQDILINQLKAKDNVKYLMGYTPSKILGEEELAGIEVKNLKTGKVKSLKLDGMFIQIGHKPDASLVKDKVECTPAGFIKSNTNMETNVLNVFVAGDIRDKNVRQIITACADGAVAATSAFKSINEMK